MCIARCIPKGRINNKINKYLGPPTKVENRWYTTSSLGRRQRHRYCRCRRRRRLIDRVRTICDYRSSVPKTTFDVPFALVRPRPHAADTIFYFFFYLIQCFASTADFHAYASRDPRSRRRQVVWFLLVTRLVIARLGMIINEWEQSTAFDIYKLGVQHDLKQCSTYGGGGVADWGLRLIFFKKIYI